MSLQIITINPYVVSKSELEDINKCNLKLRTPEYAVVPDEGCVIINDGYEYLDDNDKAYYFDIENCDRYPELELMHGDHQIVFPGTIWETIIAGLSCNTGADILSNRYFMKSTRLVMDFQYFDNELEVTFIGILDDNLELIKK